MQPQQPPTDVCLDAIRSSLQLTFGGDVELEHIATQEGTGYTFRYIHAYQHQMIVTLDARYYFVYRNRQNIPRYYLQVSLLSYSLDRLSNSFEGDDSPEVLERALEWVWSILKSKNS